MISLPAVVLASIVSFGVTNIDDVVLLTLFFAQHVPTKKIVFGQVLGFFSIVALSVAGSRAAVSLPTSWFRVLGLIPLAIGIKQFVHTPRIKWKLGRQGTHVLSIAGVTLANGADNIGVYVPFFALHHARMWIILLIYAAMLPLWCLTGKWLGNHPFALRFADRCGHWAMPLIFAGLGIYILCG